MSLTAIILVDLLGIDKLTSSFGMTLLVQGITVLVGPPICGTFSLTHLHVDAITYTCIDNLSELVS